MSEEELVQGKRIEDVELRVVGLSNGRMKLMPISQITVQGKFSFYAHSRWTEESWGISGPNDEYYFPSPRPGEVWLCDAFLLKDLTTWIATPIELVV